MPIISSSKTAVSASGLQSEFGDSSSVGRGRAGRLSPSSDGKPEAATAVSELLMMGMRMPETC